MVAGGREGGRQWEWVGEGVGEGRDRPSRRAGWRDHVGWAESRDPERRPSDFLLDGSDFFHAR